MGKTHPLDARGVPRQPVRPRRIEERLGRALLALSLAAPCAWAQSAEVALAEAAATAEAWEALSAAWRERFAALKVLLDDPARRAVALEGYPPAVQMVLEQARTLARSLQNKGLMLGKQPEYGEEQRLEYLELAARAAAFLGTPEDAAAVEFELGNALLAARRTLEAREADRKSVV